MPSIKFHIPDDSQELKHAISDFISAEFNQTAQFEQENSDNRVHKDGGLLAVAWQVVVVLASIEGSLQFAERVQRMERVKKLLAAIKSSGQSVYIKIGGKNAVDLSEKSVDETMDLLANKKKQLDEND